MDCDGESLHLVLQHIIPRARPDRRNRTVFAHGAGQQDERRIGHPLLREGQRFETVECFQREIRQD